jgi:hypothetical protein
MDRARHLLEERSMPSERFSSVLGIFFCYHRNNITPVHQHDDQRSRSQRAQSDGRSSDFHHP